MSSRDARPALTPPHVFIPPAAVAFDVDGARGFLHRRTDLPLVRLQLVIDGGASSDPDAKVGLAELTATLLREGAGARDAIAFAEEVDRLGASFGAGATSEAEIVQIVSLKRNFANAVALLTDAVLNPRFDASAFGRVKSQTIGGLRQRDEQPGAAASLAGLRVLFGPGHPLGRSSDGRPETVERIEVEDVRARWAVSAAESVSVLAAGDIEPDELRALLAPIFAARRERVAGLGVRLPIVDAPAAVRAPALRVVGVDRPGSPQTVIYFAWPGPSYGDDVRLAFGTGLAIFGGSFTSRLNANLREKHGYTYGARARGDYYRGRPRPERGAGLVTASASVQAAATGAAVREFLAEFERMRVGDITDDEVAKAKATIRNGRVAGCETLEGLMGDLAVVATFNLSPDRNARDLALLELVDAARVNAAARTLLVPDGGVLAIAGDKKTIMSQWKDVPLLAPF